MQAVDVSRKGLSTLARVAAIVTLELLRTLYAILMLLSYVALHVCRTVCSKLVTNIAHTIIITILLPSAINDFPFTRTHICYVRFPIIIHILFIIIF